MCLDVSDAVLRLHTPGITGFADPVLCLAIECGQLDHGIFKVPQTNVLGLS